ncbi:UDP-glucose 4-epimerase [Serratia plymuthica]|uniref:UDP-glucose 4-epimerase n=1 Tax=Serratia plymuthica TaxID=82996 RepID=A0A2X4X307_SERPL|nr:UDP-glucose 4-epimerase [Serratia plymuthica]
MAILVTGGAGYIGSHTVLALLERGEEVVVLDNLSNSSPESLFRVERLTGKKVIFYQGDIQEHHLLDHLFRQHDIQAVIHLAGLKSVRESTEEPLKYYQNNISGSLIVLDRMRHAGVRKFIFSSSATVYGRRNILRSRRVAASADDESLWHLQVYCGTDFGGVCQNRTADGDHRATLF